MLFRSRARRAEYWYFALFNFIILIVLMLLGVLVTELWILSGIYGLAVIVPSLAVLVRRLQDTNRSGLLVLLGFIPIVGAIILLVFTVTEGDRGPNQYGPDPKAPVAQQYQGQPYIPQG